MTGASARGVGVAATEPTVSVAMCTFDGMPYVRQQVESILAQTRLPDELVVADDGSTDDTLAQVRQVVADSPAARASGLRLRVLDAGDRPLGVTANFDRAVAACRGDVVALADQDDVWHPHKLERLVGVLSADPDALLVASDARLVGPDGEPLGGSLFATLGAGREELAALSGDRALATLVRGNVLPGMTFAFDRRLAATALPIPAGWPHDSWLAVGAAVAGGLRVLDETLVDYRQHGRNVVGVRRRTVRYLLHRLVRTPPDAPGRVERLRALRSWLEVQGGPSRRADRTLVSRALAFHERRQAFHHHRLVRAGQVARLAVDGGYRQFARNGHRDALRDCLRILAVRGADTGEGHR